MDVIVDMDQKLEANWQRRASMAENFSDSAGGRGRRFSLGKNKKTQVQNCILKCILKI